MSEPFVGEIRMFAGNFAPKGWAFCDGQLVDVSQNDALFSLLGSTYGGDGRTTFGLPDMRGRIPLHAGQGPDLTPRRLGQKFGNEKETLVTSQLPVHDHPLLASGDAAQQASPNGNVLARTATFDLYRQATPNAAMDASSIDSTGGARSHTNLMPFACVNFIIALFGIYPSRH